MTHQHTKVKPATAGKRRFAGSGNREFHALLDAAVDAVVVIDHRGTVEEFSLAAQRMFGYPADEVIGQNVKLLMPEPFRDEHDGYLDQYARTGVARIIGIGREVVARRKDGSVFPCELAVGQIADADPPRYVGFIRDLTRHKEAEEQLKRSEAELRLAQGIANLGNYVVYPRGEAPDFYSPQLYKILGLPVDGATVTGREFFERWVHPTDRARVLTAFRSLDAGGSPLDIEYKVVLRDGRIRYLHNVAQAVAASADRVLKYVGTIHDITDRRHIEDEARQLQERLTHFSRLSTMGEMAAGLAHEINQPLSAIATYAQACQRLLRQADPRLPEVIAALEQVNAQALRAGEVISRVRNFVRNRAVRREWVDCARLLDDLRTLAETDARLHNVRLSLDVDSNLPVVHADPIQLQQVVLNLLRNAIDSVAECPEVRREIVLIARAAIDGHIQITIADQGSGLAPAAEEHLYDPFFTTKSAGTGLGLAISHSIVRAHGGRLWHTANEPFGTCFHFTLPATTATNEE